MSHILDGPIKCMKVNLLFKTDKRITWSCQIPVLRSRMERDGDTPKKVVRKAKSREHLANEDCKICKTSLVLRYGKTSYVSTENLFLIPKRKLRIQWPRVSGFSEQNFVWVMWSVNLVASWCIRLSYQTEFASHVVAICEARIVFFK